jgi:hypothetical protein
MGTKISELTEQTAPANTDLVEISEDLGGGNYSSKKMQLSNLATVDKLTTNTTVNLISTQTAAQIQAEIDAQPKNLNGYTLTFQFGDGTYTLNATLTFKGFLGNVIIRGNTGDTTGPTTTRSVYLDFGTLSSGDGISVEECMDAYVGYLKVGIPDIAVSAIKFINCTSVDASQNYTFASGKTSSNYGITAESCGSGLLLRNSVSNTSIGISVTRSMCASTINDDSGTAPNYGIRANGGTVTKNSTQPAGTTSNELVINGGVIR